ncbi:MAG: ABC transporter substrate-binding protein [Chloroflexi bacterium]|nr:ABC transporter substrate-binding protein [Chloroflexota bacterium]
MNMRRFVFAVCLMLFLFSTAFSLQSVYATAKDNTLIIAHYGDTPNFDTHNNINDNGMRINTILYDPLVRMDNETYEIYPCIAESWSVSEDGTEYLFKIKKGVKFSDGTEMKLSDVVFSMQRGMESPKAVPSFARVIKAEGIGDDTLKLTLDGPYPEFLFALALPTAGIVSEKAVKDKGEDFSMDPVTTGPYMLVDWRIGERVLFKANPNYHMGEAPIKNVEYRVITDPNAAVISLEAGDIDAYVGVPPSSFKRINKSPTLELHTGLSFGFTFIQLNMARSPFDNPLVRQAIAHAIDKEEILYGIFEGDGEIVDTFALPTYLGFTDEVEKYPFDLEKSQQLIEEANLSEKTEISILLYTAKMSKLSQVLQDSLADIGIDVKINQVERSAFNDAKQRGDFDIICDGNTFTAPTVDESIYTVVRTGEYFNDNGYSNPDVDQWLDEARVTVNDNDRAELYKKVLVQLSKDLPMIPITWNKANIATNKNLLGVTANPWSFYNVYDFYWQE